MLIEVIRTLSDGTIVLKVVPSKEEIQMPEEGKQYTAFFELVEMPEFNE